MQVATFPIFKTWESQSMNEGSHLYIKAIDFGVLNPYNVTELKAPFDGKIVFVDKKSNGGGIAFESLEKVQFANGEIDYMTVWTGHDNKPPKKGTTFKQGEVYSHMGTAGGVSEHCHLEVIKGKFKMTKEVTNKGSYKFDNTIEPFNALIVPEDYLIKYSKYKWKNTPETIEEIKHISNENYKTLFDMNIRINAGTQYSRKLVKDLTSDGKKNATSSNLNAYAVYKKGTIFTAWVLIQKSNGDIWARTPSGYICIKDNNTTYCEKL